MDIINIFPDGVLIELFNKFEWKKLLYLRLISKNWKIKIESLDLTFPIKKEYIFKIIHKFSIDKFFIINKLNISKEVNVIPIFLCSNFINEAEILLRLRNFKMVEQVLNYRPLSDRKLLLQHKIQKDFLSNFNLLDTSIEVDDYLEDLNKCTEKYVIKIDHPRPLAPLC